MSRSTTISPHLPHTDAVPAPRSALLTRFRGLGAGLFRSWWNIQMSGVENLPSGPVILAPNHVGVIDGPLVVTMTPRTTFALAKSELFTGAVGHGLELIGQIPIARHYVDTTAMRRGVRVLRDGHALAIFPEGVRARGDFGQMRHGVAYLAMVTGAPIVPVALLGTRTGSMSVKDMPARGATLHVDYGQPIHIAQQPWPRPQEVVRERAEFLRKQFAAHVERAQQRTGVLLPEANRELVAAA